MNKIKQIIGFHYPCMLRRNQRGEYLMYFREKPHVEPGGFFYSNLTLAKNPRFYATIYRDLSKPKTWIVYFRRNSGQMVGDKSGFKTLMDAAHYARNQMMEWEGWFNE